MREVLQFLQTSSLFAAIIFKENHNLLNKEVSEKNKVNNYDSLARYYDFLAKLISFNLIAKSQSYYLDQLADVKRCLILGGGTASCMNQLLTRNTDLEICYVDNSQKMRQIAKKNLDGQHDNRVTFKDELSQVQGNFDAVLLFYYLDLYDSPTLKLELSKIDGYLTRKAKILVADFLPSQSVFSKLYHWAVIAFINKTTNGNLKQFQDYDHIIKQTCNWKSLKQKRLSAFYFSAIYEKMA